MFARAKQLRRKSEMDIFLQREEEKWQESELVAKSRRETRATEQFERSLKIQLERLALTIKKEEEDSKYRNELREFMQQRAEQRRMYQANKNEAQLAEFWEQRAQARREYRAARAQVEKELKVQEVYADRQRAKGYTSEQA
jgi:murein L,D-transpeptidase YcbB/YkuD